MTSKYSEIDEYALGLASWQRTGMSQWQWKQLRGEIWGEQGGTCAFPGCSNPVEAPHWQLHHLDENPRNNTRGNLRLICKSCHDKVHYAAGEQWVVEAWEEKDMTAVINILESRGHTNAKEGIENLTFGYGPGIIPFRVQAQIYDATGLTNTEPPYSREGFNYYRFKQTRLKYNEQEHDEFEMYKVNIKSMLSVLLSDTTYAEIEFHPGGNVTIKLKE